MSEGAKAAGLTLEGLGITPDLIEADCTAISLALPPHRAIPEEERVGVAGGEGGGALTRAAMQASLVGAAQARLCPTIFEKPYFPSASAIRPSVPTMTRHQANSVKPWRVT